MFFKLYNVFGEERSRYHLSVDELYLYSMMGRFRDWEDILVSNLTILDEYSRNCFQSPFHSRKGEGKKKIKNLLMSLQEKNVIDIDGDLSEFFSIYFVEDLQDNNVKGFEGIQYTDFDLFDNKTYFYIYFVIARWQDVKSEFDGDFICKYDRWAKILDVSASTAEDYLNNAEDEGYIHINRGDYTDTQARNGQKKREAHRYSVKPIPEEKKTAATRKREKKNDVSLDVLEAKVFDDYNFDTGNWLKDGKDLTPEDYIIYYERKNDKDFMAECRQKRNTLLKNPDFKKVEKGLVEKSRVLIAKKIIEKTNDVALYVKGEIIPFNEWNESDGYQFLYYRFDTFDKNTGEVTPKYYEVECDEEIYIDDYRPVDGKWDSSLTIPFEDPESGEFTHPEDFKDNNQQSNPFDDIDDDEDEWGDQSKNKNLPEDIPEEFLEIEQY